jgi:hypothetical protein
MKYNDWKLITESIGTGLTLGLSQPNVIGGLIGSHLSKSEDVEGEEIENHHDDVDDSEEEVEDNVDDSEEEVEDDVDDVDNNVDAKDDVDMSFLNDIDPKDVFGDKDDVDMPQDMGDDDMGDDDMGDDDMGDDDMGDDDMGDDDMGDDDMGDDDMGDDDMGDDDMGDDDMGDDDMGDDDMGDDDMGDDDMGDVDASQEMGDEDVNQKHKDTVDLMKKMMSYCTKYMKAESVKAEKIEKEEKAETEKVKSKKADKKEEKVEKKSKNKEVNSKKHCNCESDSFLDSLAKQTNGTQKSSLSEDALFTAIDSPATDSSDEPGQIGFAPQGRIGSIGGGYTKDDFSDIPVLGESHRLPTLTEWAANRFNKRQ